MSEPENFLSRWSRRKLDAEAPAVPPDKAAPQQTAEKAEPVATGTEPDDKTAPVFDPASLPSIDSIGAETDITAFLKAGVPGDLRLAALRRAWVTDPAIRDFKGLAENDWDFTVPNEAMGFGELDPGLDLKKMLADVFGDTPRVAKPSTEVQPEAEQSGPPPSELIAPPENVAFNSIDVPHSENDNASDRELVQRNKNDAVQSDETKDGAPVPRRRPQGGALPQ